MLLLGLDHRGFEAGNWQVLAWSWVISGTLTQPAQAVIAENGARCVLDHARLPFGQIMI